MPTLNDFDSMPLNITLSMGGVSFHLTPSEDPSDDWTSSANLPASPRTAAHRGRIRRIRRQTAYHHGDLASGYKNTSSPKNNSPIISIRRGQTGHISSTTSGRTKENGSHPQSPMHQHILGRVRAMKEKIEVEERRKSLSPPTKEAKFNSTEKSPEPRISQSSGYCVDLHSFTGTLQITPTMFPDFNNNTSRDEQTNNNYVSQESRLESLKKRRHNTAMKTSKKKSFTWIASNDSEVEIGSVGMSEPKSSSSQNQVPSLARNGVPFTPSKKFDFVDAVSDSENEPNEEDVESGSATKSVRFSFGAETLNQHGSDVLQTSVQVNKADNSLNLSAPQSLLPSKNGLDEETKREETSRSVQKEKPRISFTSPPKLLNSLARSSKHAMAQIGLGGNDAYDELGSDPAINPTGSLRSWDAVAGIGYNDVEGTELHRACASMDLANIRTLLQRCDSSDVMATDSQGKYPIHVFAENHDLITEHPEECEEMVEMLFLQLMGGPDKFVQALHPSSGCGPFVSIIGSWVDEVHSEISNRQNVFMSPNSPSSGAVLAPGATPTRTRKSFTKFKLFRASDKAERVLSSLFMQDQERAFYLPYSVYMNDHVKWAIKVLSSLIDVYPQQTRDAIVTNITSTVPLFLKCIFLLNDADDLASLAEFSLVKHTIIDKRSMNVWLIAMLTSTTRDTQMRAVSYLKLLSKLTLTDLAATSQYRERYSDEEINRFVRLRTETFDALYSMPGIFPAVLGLGGKGIESLSTTRVMRYITDRTIRKDRQFFKLICDFFYGIFLLIGFRLQIEFVFSDDHRDGPPGYRDCGYWSMSTFAIALYFLIKELLSVLSLYLTSTKLAKRYITSVFNIIDMAAVLILVVEGGPIGEDSINMYNGWAACLVTILLWLKVMGAFKILNQSFALFMYAVWEVIKEIKWFIVFLFMVTVMFSDAARAAVAVTGDCDIEPYTSSDFCSGGYFTIVRMYSVLVGDVDLDYFGTSDLMIGVFFFFSLFCIIILLNIMIAIIIDSYERTNQRPREIFGRAQVEYAAALVARKQFIRPKEMSEFHVASFVPHAIRKFLRLIYTLTAVGALIFFEYGYAGAITYFKQPDWADYEVTINNLILVYIIVGSIFNAYIFFFALIALFGWCEPSNPSARSKCHILKNVIRILEMGVDLFHRIMFSYERIKQLDLSEDVIDHSALYKSTLAPPAANTR